MREPSALKGLWISIFRRKGGNGEHCRIFSDLSDAAQAFICDAISLHEGELPVIGDMRSGDRWFVLTTKRLVFSSGGQSKEVPISHIVGVGADLDEARRKQQGKIEIDELRIEGATGDLFHLSVEPGKPLFAVWAVFQNIASANRNRA